MTADNTAPTDKVEIEQARVWVEEEYVGFSPSTSSVKPVHIANGLYRTVLEARANTSALNRAVLASTTKGVVPKGHSLDDVYGSLEQQDRIDDDVSKDDLMKLRKMLYLMLNADHAIYEGGMESYSAGYAGFVSNDRIGQDGGEFVALWLGRYAPELHELVKSDLASPYDIISIVTAPLMDDGMSVYHPPLDEDRLACFRQPNPVIAQRFADLAAAATTLYQHISQQENKLLRLRQAVLFACFLLTRHLAWLEHYYLPDIPPAIFLLDFSSRSDSAIARASQLAYNRVCQSICRFYTWAFDDYLARGWHGGIALAAELATTEPSYKGKTSTEARQYWRLAAAEGGSNPYAQAIYDILAMEAQSNPINYLRQLGIRSGLMLPAGNRQPIKRFAVRQDMLEMLVRGAVAPGKSVTMDELLELFWQRYGIIIGGRSEDEARLLEANIYQADTQELQQNAQNFAMRLQDLNFAQLLADGVLEVRVGGNDAAGD